VENILLPSSILITSLGSKIITSLLVLPLKKMSKTATRGSTSAKSACTFCSADITMSTARNFSDQPRSHVRGSSNSGLLRDQVRVLLLLLSIYLIVNQAAGFLHMARHHHHVSTAATTTTTAEPPGDRAAILGRKKRAPHPVEAGSGTLTMYVVENFYVLCLCCTTFI
jgi:hypothetical protein